MNFKQDEIVPLDTYLWDIIESFSNAQECAKREKLLYLQNSLKETEKCLEKITLELQKS